LAEKKLSPEFLRWLDEQYVACGENWAAFAEKVGIKKGTIFQWKENIVGELKEDSLEKLMRYMAQLPDNRKIVAASTSEVKDFVENGIMPGSDPNRIENITKNTVLNWLAMVGSVEDAADVGAACFQVIKAKTQPPNAGSERVRLFILSKLEEKRASAKNFGKDFYPEDEAFKRCDRWMRGLEPIPKTALFTLAAALSDKLSREITHAELLKIYGGQVVEIED
jgi:hypothetical protein